MNIELRKLELANYRNIEFAIYEFDGNSKIIGENRIGKTNTLEAIYWLLTDKLLDGSSDVSAIKPLKDTKLEVRVKATFDIDGKEVTLEKDYKENWVKTRGTTDLEMKGHTITWIHNGVPQTTLKAYNQLVSEDFGLTQDATTKIDFMQMLINPFYLGNMGESKDWTELRSFIIKLVGDVSDSDVAKARPELAIISQDLNSVSGRVDQLKKKYANDIESIKTSLIADDAQVKLLEETINPTDDEVAVAKKGIEEHQDKITALKSNNLLDFASMDISNKINDKQLEVSKLEKEDLLKAQNSSEQKDINDKILSIRKKQNDLLDSKQDSMQKISNLNWDLRNKERELGSLGKYRLDLISKLKDIDIKIANPGLETECPHCHRPYDASQLESFKDSILKELTAHKQEIIDEGKETKRKINDLEITINSVKDMIHSEEETVAAFEKELKNLFESLKKHEEKLSNTNVIVDPNPRIAFLKEEISNLEEQYRISRENYSKGIQNNQQLVYDEEQAMIPFKKVLADRDYYERQMIQLEEVRKQRNAHSLALADLEQKKELLNQFIYVKLKMLDENVSKVFGNIKFQLIKENINGGFDTICKPYIYDTLKEESSNTTWKSGSKSERVTTGIAIAEKIKEKLNLPNLPYLFDEGGEISTDTFATRFKTSSQLICVKIADNINSPLVQKL